jgi:capsular polysaccharide transport system permease protein
MASDEKALKIMFLKIKNMYLQSLRNRLFVATVILPTIVATFYFGLLASDVFISESRFVVRSPEKPATSGFGMLLKTAGFSNAGDEIYAAHNYIRSRDALATLNRQGGFARAYGSSDVSLFNRFDPLGFDGSFENLFKYYQTKIDVSHDTSSSITTLTVRGFKPDDAFNTNRALLEQAEQLVNRLNERGRADLINFAQAEVNEAQVNALRAAQALAAYRQQQGLVDPEKQAAASLQMVSKLQDELIAARTQLLELSTLAPQNPQLPVLRTRIASLEKEIDFQLGRAAGGRSSYASAAVRFQRLIMDNDLAEKQLAVAMTSLQEARNEARRKQAYVERIVQPSLPDKAIEPRRLRGVLATFVLGLIAFGIMSMLIAGVREHQQ